MLKEKFIKKLLVMEKEINFLFLIRFNKNHFLSRKTFPSPSYISLFFSLITIHLSSKFYSIKFSILYWIKAIGYFSSSPCKFVFGRHPLEDVALILNRYETCYSFPLWSHLVYRIQHILDFTILRHLNYEKYCSIYFIALCLKKY